MARALRERGYEPEATGLMHVTLEFGPAQGWDDAARRQAVLAVGAPTVPRVRYAAPPLPTAAMTPAAAWRAPRRRLLLAQAPGEVAATALTPYPPGIPLVMPGEGLDGPVVDYLRAIRRQGWPVEGLELDEGTEWLWIVDA
jgi:arginine/lysine/ornithine decarboxylase